MLANKLLSLQIRRRSNQGFTLIELLVVVVIVGILASVALPIILGQIGKAREVEGKNAVGTINRAAQAFHFEAQDFTPLSGVSLIDADNLLGANFSSEFYDFSGATITANDAQFTVTLATINGTENGIRSYSGGAIFDGPNASYATGVCQSNTIDVPPVSPTFGASPVTGLQQIICPAGFTKLN